MVSYLKQNKRLAFATAAVSQSVRIQVRKSCSESDSILAVGIFLQLGNAEPDGGVETKPDLPVGDVTSFSRRRNIRPWLA